MRYSTSISTAFVLLAALSTGVSGVSIESRQKNSGQNAQTSLSSYTVVIFVSKFIKYAFPALDPKVIATGFANNGQDVPTAGVHFSPAQSVHETDFNARPGGFVDLDEQLHQLLSDRP